MHRGSAGDRRVLSADLTQRRRGKSGEALPDESPGVVVDFDGITPGEIAVHVRYTCGEQRPAVANDGGHRPFIHGQDADGRQAEGDPQLPCPEAGGPRLYPGPKVFSGNGASHGIRVIGRRHNGRNPRIGCHSGCRNLRRNTTRPVDTGTAPPPQFVEDLVGVSDRAEQLRFGNQPRIMRIEAGCVCEDDQQAGTNQMGDDGSQSIVIAESELIDHNGVVLVDDRDNTQTEEAIERGSCVKVRLTTGEHVSGQEHLTNHEIVICKRSRIPLDELALTNGCSRLQTRQIRRPFDNAESR